MFTINLYADGFYEPGRHSDTSANNSALCLTPFICVGRCLSSKGNKTVVTDVDFTGFGTRM